MKQTAKIKKFITLNPLLVCVVVYAICYVFRLIEYLVLRTDEGILGENLVHKIAGIAIIFIVLRILHLRWRDIGFRSKHWLKNIGLGLCLGAFFYAIAYAVEFIILHCQGASPTLKLIAGSFSLTKSNKLVSVSIGFVILFNIFNVWMEEGLFRGLFVRILQQKYTFAKAILASTLLFGLWHLAMPLRAFLDGELSWSGMMLLGAGYALLSCLIGLKLSLLYKITGSLWLGLADHFLNNVIINIVHIESAQGHDKLQIVRIVLAQLLSLIFVYMIFRHTKRQNKSKTAQSDDRPYSLH